MADADKANDGFEAYYTEKLWALVPEVYRFEDGSGNNPGLLRQFIEALGEQAAVTRRSIDRLWEDQHVETCDQWAIPYIGDLVGVQPSSVQDDASDRARRADVALAINLRRRRGTLEALETSVRSTSGWDVAIVEMFRRLVRTRHRLDPAPEREGRFTRTLEGGTADLRRPVGTEIHRGPFGEFYKTPDLRQLRGQNGNVGLRKINLHLFRMETFEVTDSDPVHFPGPPDRYTIDPSGRDIQLFHNGNNPAVLQIIPGVTDCRSPYEWEVRLPIRCRLLGNTEYVITTGAVQTLQDETLNPPESDLLSLAGVRFESEARLRAELLAKGVPLAAPVPEWYVRLLDLAITDDSGRAAIWETSLELESDTGLDNQFHIGRFVAGDLSDLTCEIEVDDLLILGIVDPLNGRFAAASGAAFATDPEIKKYLYGFSARIGGGTYPRPHQPPPVPDFDDNRTHILEIAASSPISSGHEIWAGAGTRPYIRLTTAAAPDPALAPGATFKAAASGASLLIDGGWYGSAGQGNAVIADGDPAEITFLPPDTPTAGEFDWDSITIRNATLDPGGEQADGTRLHPLRLRIEASVRTLVIEESIVGPILVVDGIGRVESMVVRSSIVDAQNVTGGLAIMTRFDALELEGVTVFGDVEAERLEASHAIITGGVKVANNQDGCFRFSAASPRPGNRFPPRYRDSIDLEIQPLYFTSTRFGDAAYAQLSVVAPEVLTRGGSEMGVFTALQNAERLDSIRGRAVASGDVGVQPQFLFEGDEQLRRTGALGPPRPDPTDPGPEPPPDPGATIPPGGGPPGPITPVPPSEPIPPGGGGGPPGGGGTPVAQPTLIVLGPEDADINGAPEYWRDLNWQPKVPTDQPSSGATRSIPLDKCDYVLEYDARFGTEPDAGQGWTPVNVSASEYVLEAGGSLKFEIPSGTDGHFKKTVTTGGSRPASVHGYVVFMVDQPPTLANDGEGFDMAIGAANAFQAWEGVRATFGDPLTGRDLQLIKMIGGGDVEFSTAEPVPDMRSVWHRISLEGDFGNGEGLQSVDDRVTNKSLSWFGNTIVGPSSASLEARFGVIDSESGTLKGRVRNFVASAPGRFIRAWFRAAAVSASPILRLVLTADAATTTGMARILVRWEAMAQDADPYAIPSNTIDATVDFAGAENVILTQDLSLMGVAQGTPIWFTVERDYTHADDTHAATVHLLEAMIIPSS